MNSSQQRGFSKEKADTVQQTAKRSQYQSNTSEMNQSGYGFELSINQLMPLIKQIKQENQHLIQERDYIQTEMIKLKSLSEAILQQNTQMRNHYQQRTSDIKKIVSTMSINMNEQIEDLNHMAHMTKNHNYIIVKNIQKNKKESQIKIQEINLIQKQLAELFEKNTILQEQIITRNVRIRKLQQQVDYLSFEKEKENNIFKLEDEIDRLTEQVHILKQKNMKKLIITQNIKQSNERDKPHLTQQNIHVIEAINTYRKELNNLKEELVTTEEKVNQLQQYNRELGQKCNQSGQHRQKNIIKNQQMQGEIKQYKTRIIDNKNKQRELQSKKSQLEQQKYSLKKQIQKRGQKIKKMANKRTETKERLKSEYKSKLKELKLQQNIQIEKSNDELVFKLNPERERKTQNIEELKEQYSQLCQQVQDIDNIVKSMQNPVKEIIRLQFELKKLKR